MGWMNSSVEGVVNYNINGKWNQGAPPKRQSEVARARLRVVSADTEMEQALE